MGGRSCASSESSRGLQYSYVRESGLKQYRRRRLSTYMHLNDVQAFAQRFKFKLAVHHASLVVRVERASSSGATDYVTSFYVIAPPHKAVNEGDLMNRWRRPVDAMLSTTHPLLPPSHRSPETPRKSTHTRAPPRNSLTPPPLARVCMPFYPRLLAAHRVSHRRIARHIVQYVYKAIVVIQAIEHCSPSLAAV